MTNEPSPFAGLVNLLSQRLGAQVLEANDDFFAEKENLIKETPPVFIPDKYTDRGKWMDGWESRRGRKTGHDWCIVKLALPGTLKFVDIDTSFFLGNHPPYASLEACTSNEHLPSASTVWTPLLTQSALRPGSHNYFALDLPPAVQQPYTHLRLNIFPDGGVARLRAYGLVSPPQQKTLGQELDLAALTNGALAIACSDAFFSPMNNLLLPGASLNMGDGWESRRRRGPGHDWVIIKTAAVGSARKVTIATTHYKGNYPARCSLHACYAPAAQAYDLSIMTSQWQPLLEDEALTADAEHTWSKELRPHQPFTHLKLSIFPDGGVARLRVLGTSSGGEG